MLPDALVVVETTVPPGTCESVVLPVLREERSRRGIEEPVLLAHAYERVMPGPNYVSSIRAYPRTYAGVDERSSNQARAFLSTFVDSSNGDLLWRLENPLSSELGKLLENSYRAANIAFIHEWTLLAEKIGVNLFEIVDSIRVRTGTHDNMRYPGFGVGGYCLTKDPLFAPVAARDLFGLSLDFPLSQEAIRINAAMPLVTLDKADELLGGLDGRRLLLLGASYRGGVGDTRYSPSATFTTRALARGADVVCHDPIAAEWELPTPPVSELPDPRDFDAIVFAVAHDEYLTLDFARWLGDSRPLVIDANRVLLDSQLTDAARGGCTVWCVGRGAISA
jgi:nucleotide sugar dehydrogenase